LVCFVLSRFNHTKAPRTDAGEDTKAEPPDKKLHPAGALVQWAERVRFVVESHRPQQSGRQQELKVQVLHDKRDTRHDKVFGRTCHVVRRRQWAAVEHESAAARGMNLV
jgi:hypothetical protein